MSDQQLFDCTLSGLDDGRVDSARTIALPVSLARPGGIGAEVGHEGSRRARSGVAR